jgi:hypothetical protein
MDFGEKSNPAEVRIDSGTCRVYVKVNGSPILTNRPPMWLLEYDLLRRVEVQSAVVDPEAVPATCAETPDAAIRPLHATVPPQGHRSIIKWPGSCGGPARGRQIVR